LSKLAIVAEFWEYIRARKKWWFVPLALFLILLAGLIALSQNPTVAPFIYALW
jgi:hypothetical protein